jgi:hypothetical protein
MLNRIIPNLTKTPGSRRLWRHFLFGSTVPRAGYGLYAAEDLARRPKIDKISVAKLGIAGGQEVFALEAIAEKVSRALNIRMSVYGFHTGAWNASINRLPRFWLTYG